MDVILNWCRKVWYLLLSMLYVQQYVNSVVLYKITYCGCCLGLSSGHQLIQQHYIHTVSSA